MLHTYPSLLQDHRTQELREDDRLQRPAAYRGYEIPYLTSPLPLDSINVATACLENESIAVLPRLGGSKVSSFGHQRDSDKPSVTVNGVLGDVPTERGQK